MPQETSFSGNDSYKELRDMLFGNGEYSLERVMRLARSVNKNEVEVLLYDKCSNLKGVRIGAADAARKYGLHRPTISEWVSRGVVTPVSALGFNTGGKTHQQMMLDEADIAVQVELLKIFGRVKRVKAA